MLFLIIRSQRLRCRLASLVERAAVAINHVILYPEHKATREDLYWEIVQADLEQAQH